MTTFTLQRRLAFTYLAGMGLAAVMGALGALAAQGFRSGLDYASRLAFGSADDISQLFALLPWYLRLAVPVAGGAVAGLILLRARRSEPPGSPSVDYLDTIDGKSDHIPVVPSLMRCLSSFFSILSGGSVGKEGAMVQLSATVASAVCGRMGRLQGERFRLAVAMGATGGLAAVYHTPLAAAIFIAEIAFGGIELRRIGFLFTAAVASTWTVSAMGQFTPLYALPPYPFGVTGRAVAAVALTGLAAGVAGSLFLYCTRMARTLFTRLHASVVLRMCLGGLAVGLITLVAPDVTGNGFAPIVRLLSGEALSSPLWLLLLLKIAATAATVGSGAIGGLFTPSLLVGALTGSACAPYIAHVLGLSDSTVLLGVVGMAAALAATTQAPLMCTLMVFEMTQEPTFIFPLMLACVMAYAASQALGQSGVYEIIGRHRERFEHRSSLSDATAGAVMRPPGGLANVSATLGSALEIGLQQKNRFVFVVNDGGGFVGAVWTQDLMARANAGDGAATALGEMARRDFPVVYENQKLFDVWQTVIESPAERTPVLADEATRQVVGVLQKSDLLQQARTLFV